MTKYQHLSKEELLKLIEKQEQELKNKKYGLVWDREREPEQVVLDCANHLPVLKRVKSKEIKTDDSEDNILIEGDNYHTLTVLNYTHKGKIDVIYIDPPYNTGKANEWKYNDKYVDKNDSYRHSKWLNFMEKRLKLAKELLKDEGIIFISIDDHEVAQLKLLMDTIWGEENFIVLLPTIMNLKGNNDQFGFAGTHEYTLVYAKNKEKVHLNEFCVEEEELEQWNEDKIGLFKKGAPLRATGAESHREDRIQMFYPILFNKTTGEISTITKNEFNEIYDKKTKSFNDNYLKKLEKKYTKKGFVFILPKINTNEYGRWRWGYNTNTINKLKTEVLVKKTRNGYSLYKKQRPKLGDLPTKKPKSLFYKPEYNSGNGTSLLKEMFGKKVFDNPKPLALIKDLLFLSTNKDSIILDFFAGSGTTGHAVLKLNKEDGGNRKFILVTNNEGNIATEVCYPRLKKVIKGYNKNGDGEWVEGLGGNLQYFKASLIKKSKNRDQVKIDLTQKVTEMLCVKENIYNLEKKGEDYKIFSSNKGDRFLGIYYNFIDDSFDEFLEELKKLNGEKIIYMFAIDNKVDKSLFSELDNFTIEPIPEKILDIYDQLVKMNISIKAETIFLDLEKAQKQIFENKDKDTGAKILRVVLEKLLQKIAQLNQINILNDKGKEIKISNLNDVLYKNQVINQIEWQENQTYLTIGNHASHGDYDKYDLGQVKNFYKHVQSLIDKFNI